jgi:PIN domain nuclease of toxin-antitoxin system
VIALLDTHVLLWWHLEPRRLSREQRRAIARADDTHALGVSDASMLEVAQLVERGRVRLNIPIDHWLSRATAGPLVERVGISPAIAREVVDLQITRDWDPADRVLVATARVLGIPLVTSDGRIVDSELVETV